MGKMVRERENKKRKVKRVWMWKNNNKGHKRAARMKGKSHRESKRKIRETRSSFPVSASEDRRWQTKWASLTQRAPTPFLWQTRRGLFPLILIAFERSIKIPYLQIKNTGTFHLFFYKCCWQIFLNSDLKNYTSHGPRPWDNMHSKFGGD